jgi:hypothetical protein
MEVPDPTREGDAMNPPALDPLTLILWGAAALVALGVLLPMVLAILGLTRVQFLSIAGPEAVERAGDGDPRYPDLLDQLRDLGFDPLAVRVERAWFYLWYWVRTSLPGAILGRRGKARFADGRDCFATLYRLYRGDPWRLSFATILTDGTLVSTANQIERLRINRPGYWRAAYITEDPSELLRVHEKTVADFAARGWTVATPDLTEYHQVAAERTQEYLRESGKLKAAQSLQAAAVFMAAGALGAGLALGFGHWGVPTLVIVCGVFFELLMPTTIRTGAQSIRQQEQADAVARRWAAARRRQAEEQIAGRQTGVISSEQRPTPPRTIQADAPPRPPTDLMRPPD